MTNEQIASDGKPAIDPAEAAKLWAELDKEDAADALGFDDETPIAAGSTDGQGKSDDAVEEFESAPVSPAAAKSADAIASESKDPKKAVQAPAPSVEADRISGLEQTNRVLQENLRTLNARYGGLNSQMEKLRKSAGSAGVSTPSAIEIQKALGDAESMKTLKADYPEFGGAMENVLGVYGEKIAKIVDDAVKTATPKMDGFVSREEFESALREQATDLLSPGWREKIVQPDFRGWLIRQDAATVALAQSDNPRDAVSLIEKYDQARGAATAPPPAQARTRRLASAAALPSGSGSSSIRSSVKDEKDMTPAELWAHLDKIEAAQERAR